MHDRLAQVKSWRSGVSLEEIGLGVQRRFKHIRPSNHLHASRSVTGIGKPRGRSGQKTLVYVELDGDGVRAAFPIDSIRFIE